MWSSSARADGHFQVPHARICIEADDEDFGLPPLFDTRFPPLVNVSTTDYPSPSIITSFRIFLISIVISWVPPSRALVPVRALPHGWASHFALVRHLHFTALVPRFLSVFVRACSALLCIFAMPGRLSFYPPLSLSG